MCGICGLWGATDADDALLADMATTLRHRGPDETGKLIKPPVGLAMTRLAIIDLSGGSQPITSADDRVSLVFNGEIYNFRELRAEIAPHVPFRTRSDTEVILNGYQLWGEDVFRRLNGMFAVALFDRAAGALYLVRDPMGIKPLYYMQQARRLLFSSELKTFTTLKLANRANMRAIRQFLAACYVFHPDTALDGVEQVAPGTWLRIGRDGRINRSTFRWPGGPTGAASPADERDAEAAVADAVTAAVVRQTVADVPFGLLLSAGIDSMAVLAALHRHGMTENLRTYTLYFPDAHTFSENKPVAALAARLGFENVLIPFAAADLRQHWDAICHTFDNLDMLPTCAAIYLLSREVSRDRRLVLAGNGGDELFLGYPTYRATQFVRRLRWAAPLLQGILPSVSKAIPPSKAYLSLGEKIRRFCAGYADSPALSHAQWRHVFTVDEINIVLTPDYWETSAATLYGPQLEAFEEAGASGLVGLAADQWMDLRTWMVDSGLMMWDKAGMASSVEIRLPIIDLDLVDTVLEMPIGLRGGRDAGNKPLLRAMVRKELPGKIANLPKHGFQLPIHQWMRGELREMFRDLTLSLPTHVFDRAAVAAMWQEFEQQKGDHALKLWALGALAGWSARHDVRL